MYPPTLDVGISAMNGMNEEQVELTSLLFDESFSAEIELEVEATFTHLDKNGDGVIDEAELLVGLRYVIIGSVAVNWAIHTKGMP